MHQFFEFATRHWEYFASLFLILAMLFGGGFMRRLRGYEEADATTTVQLMNHNDALLIDVREDSEFREGHILNARHIPLGTLCKRLNELEGHKDRRTGSRCSSTCLWCPG